MNFSSINETGINTSTISIIYLILPIFLSMILLNKIYTYIYSILNISTVLIYTLILQNPVINYIIIRPILIMIFASTLLFFGTHHLSKLEEDRKKTILESKEELKKAHGELQNLNKILEIKVDERTKKIQFLLKQKDEFINQLGHDLKNPLGPMLHLLPILERKEQETKYKDMIRVLQRNAGYMKNLVTKTIDLAQLNSSQTNFNFEKINLTDEINQIIQTNKMLFDEKNIRLIYNFTEDQYIYADKLRIGELINNLFNNAVKYSKENSSIEIIIDNQPENMHVSIKDTGIGMTQDQLSHIFDEFYKADESRHDFESSGLGMPICKRIVEKHGGKIWAESPGLGAGSTIHFNLPKHKK
jgi:signal transduction histidine kinase